MEGSQDDLKNPLLGFLASGGAVGELVRPGAEMPTVPLAAAALGVTPDRIVKSIVFCHKKDKERACLAIAPGDGRVQIKKVAAALGLTQLKLASPETALAATGYAIGGVPPVGHTRALPVVIDASLMALDEVWGGGGDCWHMLRIAPTEIVRVTGAVIADVLDAPGAGAPDGEP